MQPPVEWLLSGPAYVQHRARVDLLGQVEDSRAAAEARQAMLAEPLLQPILGELQNWPGQPLTSHRSAAQLYHKLNFLADLGFTAGDPGLQPVITAIMAHTSEQGPFQLLIQIPAHFGGSGEAGWAWMLCDAPLLVYALIHLGLGENPRVQKALDYLNALVRDNGWPCAAAPELGRFRGPGRKEDPCPYANLAMLKALGQVSELRHSPEACTGVETLLGLWERRREQHPYLFYMGTDFCKLKAPLLWYDILHVLDVLSLFPWVHHDPRYQDMLDQVKAKANPDGLYTPESIYTAWKDWDFGQKKAPSPWVTLLIYRIYQRAQAASIERC